MCECERYQKILSQNSKSLSEESVATITHTQREGGREGERAREREREREREKTSHSHRGISSSPKGLRRVGLEGEVSVLVGRCVSAAVSWEIHCVHHLEICH